MARYNSLRDLGSSCLCHALSLDMVLCETLNRRAKSACDGRAVGKNFNASRCQVSFGIATPPLALSVSLQSDGGHGFALVKLRHHAPVCADASPLLDKQDMSEKIGLNVEPVEAAHVAGGIDAAKMQGV